jgi:hypothetical protein
MVMAPGLSNMDPAKVQTIGSVKYVPDIQRVGKSFAETHVKMEHLRGFV